MNVLFVGPALDVPGGVSNYCRLMLESLRVSTTYHVVGRRKGEMGVFAGIRRIVSDCRAYVSRVKEVDPDVIQFNPSLNAQALLRDVLLLQLSRRSKARKVVFIHGWDPKVAARLERGLLKWLVAWALRPVSCFIVLSAEYRKAMIDIGVRAPVFIETVAVQDLVRRKTNKSQFRSKGIRLLFLSRIERAKGVQAAIQTHKLLLKRGRISELAIAGDGPNLDEARRVVADEKIDGVSFLGYVNGDDKDNVLSNASIFIFPTQYGEGLPTCVLEAMTYGLPVITTPVGGIQDFFEHGKMGFLTPDIRPTVLADYVEQIADNAVRSGEMSKYNEAYARQRFNASAVSHRLTELYGRI